MIAECGQEKETTEGGQLKERIVLAQAVARREDHADGARFVGTDGKIARSDPLPARPGSRAAGRYWIAGRLETKASSSLARTQEAKSARNQM